MRLLSLAPLLAFTACAAPDGPPPGTSAGGAPRPSADGLQEASDALRESDAFDVQAWLAEVDALNAEAEGLAYDTLVARSLRLAGRIDPVVAWRRACDTYHDPSTGEADYDPLDPEGEADVGRGLMDVNPLGAREAAVSVLCNRGAYQGSWSLIHVEGDRASMVRMPELDERYAPMDIETGAFGEPLFEPGTRLFSTFVKSRGMGDCGVLTQLRLGEAGRAEILEVRARECADEPPEDLGPDTWPVVYPR